MTDDTCRALDQFVDAKPAPAMKPDDYIPMRPIPISERLPKPYDPNSTQPQDCDPHGRCWWGWWSTPCAYVYWELESKSAWQAMPGRPPVCWLPHWALPLPEVEIVSISNDPLWRVLHRAHMDADPLSSTYGYAAEIRALADWLVPESSCRPYAQTLYHEGGADTRLRLRTELLTEADRAEASD